MPSGTSTSLGSLEYKLATNLPSFYVSEIETIANEQQCFSRKLRQEALSVFLEELKLGKHTTAVNFRAKEGQINRTEKHGPIDHLIIQCENPKPDFSNLSLKTTLVAGVTMDVRNSDGELNRHGVYCRIRSKPELVTPTNEKLYTQCLSTFVHTVFNKQYQTNGNTGRYSNPPSTDWTGTCPNFLSTGSDRAIPKSSFVSIRTEPKLNIKDATLRMDCDLILRLSNETNLKDFLFDFLGNKVLDPSNSNLIATIKGVLVGLRVAPTYDRSKVKDKSATKPVGLRHKVSTMSIRGRYNEPVRQVQSPPEPICFRIQDLKLAGEIPRFTVTSRKNYKDNESISTATTTPTKENFRNANGSRQALKDLSPNSESRGNTLKTQMSRNPKNTRVPVQPSPREQEDTETKQYYSVVNYFKNIKGIELKYPTLPLAQVGHDTWIPIELLKISGEQSLRNTGYLSSFMKTDIAEFCSDSSNAIETLEAVVNGYIDTNSTEILKHEPPRFFPPPGAKEPPKPVRREEKMKINKLDGNEQFSACLVYFSSPHALENEDDQFIERVAYGLQNQRGVNMKFKIKTLKVINIERTVSLAKHFQGDNSEVRPQDILIVVLDEQGRSKADLNNIRAEVYRYADLQAGSIVLCVSRKDLGKSYARDAPVDHQDSAYFPKAMLQKINYMVGGTNVIQHQSRVPNDITPDTPPRKEKNSEKMIFGAHISHPGSNAGANCPSVAAIVATDRTAKFYLASARLQRTIERVEYRYNNNFTKSGAKQIVQNQIEELRAMVVERLEARGDPKSPPDSIIFFRRSIDANSALIQEEIRQIEEAYRYVYSGVSDKTIKLNYYVASSNAGGKQKYAYTSKRNDLNLTPDAFHSFVSFSPLFAMKRDTNAISPPGRSSERKQPARWQSIHRSPHPLRAESRQARFQLLPTLRRGLG